ncbi:MAG: plastocyanin/azurin family copper-binding protein [Acidimicrobiia bacterium]
MGRAAWLAGLAATTALLLPLPARAATAVALERSRFEPARVSVPAGETVVWTNNDSVGHTVTADDGSFDSHPSCGSIGGTCMTRGQTFQTTFSKPGTFPYHCRVHGGPGGRGMAGTIAVT